MVKKHLRSVASTFIIGIMFGAFANVVLAATATSNELEYGPINGFIYKNNSTVSSDWTPDEVASQTHVNNKNGGEVPTGYMGAQTDLYKTTGLCSASDVYYNPLSTVGYGVIIYANCGSGTYYSKGTTYAYNGNGYNSYNTYQSPNINF